MTAEDQERPVLLFWGRTEVTRYLGNTVPDLPPHDGEVGARQLWFPAAVIAWAAKHRGEPIPENLDIPIIRFLGRTEVAHYLNMKTINSLSGVTLPPHNAEISDRAGWFPATIDAWNAQRPGRGRWGARPVGRPSAHEGERVHDSNPVYPELEHLTRQHLRAIRRSTDSTADLASQYGVSEATIRKARGDEAASA